jgi:hypothetical protein
MTTEKLQNLAACAIVATEKVKILKLWNSSKAQQMVKMFPVGPFNDNVFNLYLHKHVLWVQLQMASMDEILPMTGLEILTGKQPSVHFPAYIENSRIREWDYAYNQQIESKEIQKSFEWSKQPHGQRACRRLIYRLCIPKLNLWPCSSL